VSVQAIAWVLTNSQAKGAARCVLLSIANHVDPDGSGWVHVRRVLSEANCSLDSYRRAVQEAEDRNEIVRQTHAGGSIRMHDAHRPNLFVFPALAAGDLGLPAPTKGKQQAETGADVLRIFEHWVNSSGRDPVRTRLTTQRKRKVQARLNEGYTIDEILAAIEGVRQSSFHQGVNDSGTRYDDLTVICRDGSQVERFAALTEESDPTAPSVVTRLRGCELCDNGFIFHDDGTVSICQCPTTAQTRA
jgi:hypothetical protein